MLSALAALRGYASDDDNETAAAEAQTVEAAEQAQEHGGRVRCFPHVAGQFAVHCYVPLPPLPARVAALASAACRAWAPQLQLVAPTRRAPGPPPRGPPAGEHHVSLSRVAPVSSLAAAMELVDALREALRGAPPPTGLRLAPPCAALVNDGLTRTFLALEADAASACALGRCLRAVDDAFCSAGLPRFYAPPRPHASLAWALGDCAPRVEAAAAAAEAEVACGLHSADASPLAWAFPLTAVILLVGQREHVVWGALPR